MNTGPECPHCHQPSRLTVDNPHYAVCENKHCSMGMWRVTK